MPSAAPEDLRAIRQALGLDRTARPYRNHYAAPANDSLALGLVRRGLMQTGTTAPGGLMLFLVTPAGARLAGTTLPDLGLHR